MALPYKEPVSAAKAALGLLLILFTAIGMLVAFFPPAMIQSFVVMRLWNWFVVPYFHIALISYWPMMGLGYTLRGFTQSRSKKGEETDWSSFVLNGLITPWIVLLIGYLIHQLAH